MIKIGLDQALDIDPVLAASYNIGIGEATVMLSGTQYVSLDPEILFREMDNGGTASTTAINVTEYEEMFDSWLRDADELIYIPQSEKISANYQNALIASENRNVSVIDSKTLSSGGAILALVGARMINNGADRDEIVAKMNSLVDKIDASFVLNTLKYMAKGGRCKAVVALGANILKLKPCIEVKPDGSMDVGKKYRGTLEASLTQYIEDKLADIASVDTSYPVFITHSLRVPEATITAVKERLRSAGFTEIHEVIASATISVHCGPGTLGILFLRK